MSDESHANQNSEETLPPNDAVNVTSPTDEKPACSGLLRELPVIFFGSAFLLSLILQTMQLNDDRKQLEDMTSRMEKPMADAKKMRDQVEFLASRTVQLANQGDAYAQAIVDGMRRQGITVLGQNTQGQK